MSELKIGDRVEVLRDNNGIDAGTKGTIIEISDYTICVEFDEYEGGHSCGGKGKKGHCRCINSEFLRKIEEKEVEKMKEKTLKEKMLELLRKEIGVDENEMFDVYEITDSLYKNKKEIGRYVFRRNKFIRNENGEFHESNIWKDIAANIYKYEFRKRPFVPEQEETYYSLFVQSNNYGELVIEGVTEDKWIGLSTDYQRFAALNVFKTEEEALRNKDKFLKRLNKLLRTEYV
ncbi:MAG: hypothetical protein E6293_01515 [Dialister sp.]|nr:hypothetical protein [Dialister sp.]